MHNERHMKKDEKLIREFAALAGVEINGSRERDMQVLDTRFYSRMLRDGPFALGESYMDGWWDVASLDDLIFRFVRADLERRISPLKLILPVLKAKMFNLQHRGRAFRIGEHHYDLGNDLYRAMLDKRMTYTCGYWKGANDLDQAQEAKLELVCRKIGLQQGMTVLDIGCGWGSFARYAVEKYGVSVTGITVSKEQVELGRSLCEGMPVEFRLQDYRDVTGVFDRVVSLGMFEHVGVKNYGAYMQIVERSLADNGIFLLHTIGANEPRFARDPWTEKYIFPDSILPCAGQIARAAEGLFVMEDWHNFGTHYDPTLMAWMENCDRHWESLDQTKYDGRFYRMWKYFLLTAAGAFRARRNQLWQVVFTKRGLPGGLELIR
jgi:cyclopropane-fatty-acyl-phospholipid synthase